MVEAFLGRYYVGVAPADLVERDVIDLCGAALAHWQVAQHREPGHAKVRIYTPDFEVHGWQSTHTALAVVTDDMPFLVDSLSMELSRHGLAIHLIVHPVIAVVRDSAGHLVGLTRDGAGEGAVSEAFIHVEIDRQSDAQVLAELGDDLLRVLGDVRAAVEDWPDMRQRALQIAGELERERPPVDPDEVADARALLEWICDGRFVFLGYREYDLVNDGDEGALRAAPGSGLGILRELQPTVALSLVKFPPEVRRVVFR
jgi:glutamate dehydrogenase